MTELVEAGVATWFDAGKGRPMHDWASVPEDPGADWPALVAEAFAFVGPARDG